MNRALLVVGVLVAAAGLGVMAWFTFGPGGAGTRHSGGQPPAAHSGPGAVAELSDATFDAAVAEGVVLVEFYAPRFPLSIEQRPIVEKLAEKYAGRARVARIDNERNNETRGKLQVATLPMLFVYRDGQQIAKLEGIQTEEKLVAEMDRVLAGTEQARPGT